MTPKPDTLVGVLRAVALHGPMPRVAAECWHLDGVGDDEQRDAVTWLVDARMLVEESGTLDLRGVDRSRPLSAMGPVERAAREEAIEISCRVAVLTAQVTGEGVPIPARLAALGEVAGLGFKGIEAAKRADAARRDGR